MRALGGAVLVLAAFAVWTGAATAQQRPLPALAPAADDALVRALSDGELTEAQYALERARSLFRLGAVRREFGQVERQGRRDATLVLRDLALRLPQLSGAERRQAERLLARPDDNDWPDDVPPGWEEEEAPASPTCDPDHLCIHWVDTGPDAPPPADSNMDGIPDHVDKTLAVFQEVWAHEIDTLGYREPLDDGVKGGDGRFDVYLDDLGPGLFGYCAPDSDYVDDPDHAFDFAFPIYCVVDNDYIASQFPLPPEPDAFLKVTAAHEFFHAVQGAYDFGEDWWLMEGTATNMEETVYPTIDDNVFFLDNYSPLTRPRSPLDRWGAGDGSEYGSWIFWRYLEEKIYGGDPSVIMRVWGRAAWAFGPDEHSLQAVARVLRNDGVHLADAFAGFGVANRLLAYADGNLYPGTPTHRAFRIGPAQRRTAWQARRMNHLTTQYFSFRPRSGVSRRARLGVNVDVHPRGGRARVIVFYKNGKRAVRAIRLDRQGNGNRRVPIGRGVVRRVDLVLSNGSSRMRNCFSYASLPF
ncbi:MAG: MXAN_6640 family putative metalloprotease, partial [Thermoleophilaceae bacterium]